MIKIQASKIAASKISYFFDTIPHFIIGTYPTIDIQGTVVDILFDMPMSQSIKGSEFYVYDSDNESRYNFSGVYSNNNNHVILTLEYAVDFGNTYYLIYDYSDGYVSSVYGGQLLSNSIELKWNQ